MANSDHQTSDHQTIEEAFANTEADALDALKSAKALIHPLRRFHAATQVGDMREMRSSLEAAENALAQVRQDLAAVKKGWRFDEQRYLASGGYAKEILAAGRKMGVPMFEREERLYCYPSLIRVLPSEKALVVDRKRERRLRPSVLINALKARQNKAPNFRPEAFLAALFAAYSKIGTNYGDDLLTLAPVIPLVDIYGLLTMLPGQTKEYSKQEFTRDIYLLHRGGVETTKSGAKVSFPISRGVRGKTLGVIDETGEERRYYGIRFSLA